MSSRPPVMKQLRMAWNQNLAPSVSATDSQRCCGLWMWSEVLVSEANTQGPGDLRHSRGRHLRLQRLAGLGLFDSACEHRDVDALPAQGQDLLAAHAGIGPTRVGTRCFAFA